MSILRIRDVRLLVGAVAVSAAGDLLLWTVIALDIGANGGSALAVSAFFVCLWGPVVALGGVAGVLVDRYESRALLIGVSLLQAGIVGALALATGSLPVVLALSVLLGATVAFSSPAEFALIAPAAGEDCVAEANGHIEAARYLGMTAGPLLGGLLAAAGGTRVALLIDAASFLAVAGAGALLHARRDPRTAGAAAATPRARDGIAFVRADRTLAVSLGTAVGALVFFSMSVAAEVFFATDVLGAGQAGFGALISAWTLGMVGGAVGVARLVPRGWLARGVLAAIAVQGAGMFGAAAVAVLSVALAGFVVGGVAHGVKNVLARTLIHERVPDAMRGRVFATYNAARNGAELGALGLGGVAVGALGAQAALALSGAIPLAIGLAALALLTRRREAAHPTTTTRRTAYAHLEG
ncbi:MAG TPA: MFS transporter [Solirubrobacteraceae bacterium]|nr:MFS transporter [Solirubrobacteraceae bacterium]